MKYRSLGRLMPLLPVIFWSILLVAPARAQDAGDDPSKPPAEAKEKEDEQNAESPAPGEEATSSEQASDEPDRAAGAENARPQRPNISLRQPSQPMTLDPWTVLGRQIMAVPLNTLPSQPVVQIAELTFQTRDFEAAEKLWSTYFQRNYRQDFFQFPNALHAMGLWRLSWLFDESKTAAENMSPALLRVLMTNPEAAWKVVRTLRKEDDIPKVFELLDQLAARFPDVFLSYFDVALALAVIWDQPPRHPFHNQVSPSSSLPITPQIEQRFAFFVRSDREEKLRYPFRTLSPQEIILVVDAPAPVTELEWAQNNVRGTAINWFSKFYDIGYDGNRADRGLYVWDKSPYTLRNIERYGGLCVDQAYYAAVTAKANGIPSLYFHGTGRRGDHAWFGYLQKRDKWDLEVGRYYLDNYVTGYTVDPQTGVQLTNHEVELIAMASGNSTGRWRAQLELAIAELFYLDRQLLRAAQASEAALQLAPELLETWRAHARYLSALPNATDQLAAHYQRMMEHFRRTSPDLRAEAASGLAQILRLNGQEKEADDILRYLVRKNNDDRYDVAIRLQLERIRQLEAQGDIKGCEGLYEDIVRDFAAERGALVDVLSQALEMYRRNNMTRDGLSFIKWSLRRISPGSVPGDLTYYQYLEILATAYEYDGDPRRAERLRKNMERAYRYY
jgi:tetratricopeptide (TPR) repeat protein